MDARISSLLAWLPLAGVALFAARAVREYIQDWRMRGPVVFDAGGSLAAKLLGGVFCGTLLYLTARWISDPLVWLGAGLLVGIVTVAATARQQICENGLWHGFGLIPWIAVTDYRWTDDGMLTLSFHEEAASRPVTMTVPLEDVPRLKQWVSERVFVWTGDEAGPAESDIA